MNQTLIESARSGHYLNSQWITGSGRPFYSINPASGETIWQGNTAIEAEIKSAYQAAYQARMTWGQLTVSERAHYLLQFAQCVEDNANMLTHAIALETGKPLWEAATEVHAVAAKVGLSIKAYQERCPESRRPQPDASIQTVRYKPHGVVAVLGPFNFPAHLSNGHIVPALLAGNTVLYKPSELTPAVAALIMHCWHEAQLPAGVLQCLQGDATTAQIILQQDIQAVFFTGSYLTGQRIHQQLSGRPEVLLALEMGGNNPIILGEVDSIPVAVHHAILSTLMTAGQRCTCARRLIIPDTSFGDAFIQAYINACLKVKIGPFTQTPEPFMGPVIRPHLALDYLKKQHELEQSGGKILLKMTHLQTQTGFLSPGVIEMTAVTNPKDEEIFAPFVQVYRYHDFENALLLANQTRYGLVAALFSQNPTQYQTFLQTINAGLINWNRPTTGAASGLPFGGIGHSGNHRPSAYFAADYCAYPVASLEQEKLVMPTPQFPGLG